MPKPPPIDPRYVRLREAMRRSGFNRSRLYELLGLGEIRAVKDGRSTLFDVVSLDACLDRLKPWSKGTGPLLTEQDQTVAPAPDTPDFVSLFAECFQRLSPAANAWTKAFAATTLAYRRHHKCDHETANAAVQELLADRQ